MCWGFVYSCESHNVDKTEEIIVLVERNPTLYDKTEKNHRDTTKKKDVCKELGQKVGLTFM